MEDGSTRVVSTLMVVPDELMFGGIHVLQKTTGMPCDIFLQESPFCVILLTLTFQGNAVKQATLE